MATITDKTIGATSTSILAAADWKNYSGPLYLKNESGEVITLTIAGSDDYSLDPGEIVQILPGQVVTGTAVGGAALLQIIAGIVPADESAAKSGGGVTAAGAVSAASGRGIWSTGQDDFTTVYASATTLTLGTFPTALGTPDDGNFALVVVTDSAGLQTAYVPTANAMTLSGQVLTVAGASFAASDLDYDVFVWGPPKSYDASINGDQVQVLNPDHAWTQESTLVDATDVTDATVVYPTAGIDFDQYRYGGFQISLDCDTGTVTATVEASFQDDGVATGATAAYVDVTNALFGVASLVATAGSASALWVISAPFPAKYLRVKIVYATTDNSGDATVYFRGTY
jgi:hypothetical protein